MAKTKPKRKRQDGPSHSGYHYYNLYQCCPRKFYINYWCRLTPKYKPYHLIYGAAFHEAKATFYKTGSIKRSLNKLRATVKRGSEQLDPQTNIKELNDRYGLMFESWANEYGQFDLEAYTMVAVEKELRVIIDDELGFYVTLRPDALLQHKRTNRLYIMETKTTGWSGPGIMELVEVGEQARLYSLGVRSHYKHYDFGGVIADVTFWHKSTTDPSKLANFRGSPILYSDNELEAVHYSVKGTLRAINQRIEALRQKTNSHPCELFPMNRFYCKSFNRKCDFYDICARNLSRRGRAPLGFVREPHQSRRFPAQPTAVGV